jgi:hypothetical protein
MNGLAGSWGQPRSAEHAAPSARSRLAPCPVAGVSKLRR